MNYAETQNDIPDSECHFYEVKILIVKGVTKS